MSIEQDNGKPARLSLPERASTYRWYELWAAVSPDTADSAGYPKRLAAIRDAVSRYELPALNEPPPAVPLLETARTPDGRPFQHVTFHRPPYAPLVARADFLAWLNRRGELPESWLGATPTLPESNLPVETSLPELPGPARLTEAQQDKADCQAIARELWAEQPNATQADILKNSRIKPYLKKWPGKNTLPGWLSEVDPRPKEQRQGRPRKTPV